MSTGEESTVVDTDLASLRRGKKLGDGAQGSVFEVEGGGGRPEFPFPVVYKEFKPEVAVSAHLLGQLGEFRRRSDPGVIDFIDEHLTWPLAVVTDGSRAAGYLMRRIEPAFSVNLHAPDRDKPTPSELQLLKKDDRHFIVDHGFTVTWAERVHLALELARIYDFLHRHHFIYGDLNWRNALWSVDPRPRMLLIDCDGIRRHGNAAPVAQLHSPQWIPPEGAESQSYQTDRYKLALAIFRMFSPGLNGQFQGAADPHYTVAAARLRRETVRLLKRALKEQTVPLDRPGPREWIGCLEEELRRARRRKRKPGSTTRPRPGHSQGRQAVLAPAPKPRKRVRLAPLFLFLVFLAIIGFFRSGDRPSPATAAAPGLPVAVDPPSPVPPVLPSGPKPDPGGWHVLKNRAMRALPAKLLAVDGTLIEFETRDGRRFTYPIDGLAGESQDLVEQLRGELSRRAGPEPERGTGSSRPAGETTGLILTLRSGRRFFNASVKRLSATDVLITHHTGMARVPMDELPDELRESLGPGQP